MNHWKVFDGHSFMSSTRFGSCLVPTYVLDLISVTNGIHTILYVDIL